MLGLYYDIWTARRLEGGGVLVHRNAVWLIKHLCLSEGGEKSIPLISSDITVFALATKLLSCNTASLTYTGL